MNYAKVQKVLVGITCLALLGLFIAPQTRWLMLYPMESLRALPLLQGEQRDARIAAIVTASVPCLCAVILILWGVIVETAAQERAGQAALLEQAYGEGPYLSQQMGKPWPGLTG
jgi:hypothetical protein